MECRQLRECVAPLLDGELEAERLAEASQHLENCPDCMALVEKLATVPVRPTPAQAPRDPAFWEAMDKALSEEAERPVGSRRRFVDWLRAEVRLSRGVVLAYLALLGLAFAWHLLGGVGTPTATTDVQTAALEGEEPTAAPHEPTPPSRRSQRLEKASYAPVQQTF